MVLRHTFHGKTADLVRQVREYYDGAGGFRALKSAPVADLLSTAVVLYALRYVGEDLRPIKPGTASVLWMRFTTKEDLQRMHWTLIRMWSILFTDYSRSDHSPEKVETGLFLRLNKRA